jgi:hypothetical protein
MPLIGVVRVVKVLIVLLPKKKKALGLPPRPFIKIGILIIKKLPPVLVQLVEG